MKIIFFALTILFTNQFFAQSLNLKKGTTLWYKTTEGDDSTNLKITILDYSKQAIFSFTNWQGKAPYGKITIKEKDLQKGLHPSLAPKYIYERRSETAIDDSGIWLSKNEYNKLLKTKNYILKDKIHENKDFKFTAIPTQYSVKKEFGIEKYDAYQLTSDTIKTNDIYFLLKFIVLKNEKNPLILKSESILIKILEARKEEVIFSMEITEINNSL